jgi:parallel beta-helix repeat protein
MTTPVAAIPSKQFTYFRRVILVFAAFITCGMVEARAYPPLEYAVKQTGTATFYIDFNGDSNADRVLNYGAPSFVGLAGDFDGDTITDLAVYDNGVWYIDFFNNTIADRQVVFGGPVSLDTPIVADFNGDGKADIGVYRNDGFWYLDFNLDGSPDRVSSFGGIAGDIPVAGDFNGDGNTDRVIYRQGRWFADFDWNGTVNAVYTFGGGASDVPLAADFNNDGASDLVIFRDGVWYHDFNRDSTADRVHLYGGTGMRPLVGFFNTANSVFVRAGAAGARNGSQMNPFATINAALASNPPQGSIIRIAVGNYPERVSLSQRSNLTFQGSVAGPNFTGTAINPGAGDAFSCFLCSNITLRDLRITSGGPDGSTPGRGIVNLGSSMTLEHVGAIGSRSTNVVAAQHFPSGFPGSLATINIDRSAMDASQIGNGIQLEQGATATITRSSVSSNGTNPAAMPGPPAAPGGRGIVLFGNANATVRLSNVNSNFDGGFLATSSARGVLQENFFISNGTNGIYYELQATGSITGNTISLNGVRGTRGPGGFNGIEISGLGSPMTISGNTLSNNTLNAIYVGDGTVTVLNNTMFGNFLGMTIDNPFNRPVNVTVRGNTIEIPVGAPYSEGIFMASSTSASMTIIIGGSAAADKNTFRNYGSFPAIHCNVSTINAQCVAGGNIFINSSFPVQNCPSCSP